MFAGMMRMDEINPLDVEGTEAATNLETTGYEALSIPSMDWTKQV